MCVLCVYVLCIYIYIYTHIHLFVYNRSAAIMACNRGGLSIQHLDWCDAALWHYVLQYSLGLGWSSLVWSLV